MEVDMKKNRSFLGYLSIPALMFFFSACSLISANSSESTEADENIVGMANPSAVYCEGLGYPEESVERNGGMDADCIFPDGSRCGAWDLLSGRCGQEYTYCEMQGGTIEEGANIGTCRFSDGSSCDEYQYFLGECAPGDNPGYSVEDSDSSEDEAVEIQGFSEARDFMAAYFLNKYDIAQIEPWSEENITPENAAGFSTFRYVSGPLTIVITAEAAAPYPILYTIDEASNIANGFYWEGSLSIDGAIEETLAYPPGTVLNEEQARDTVLDYLENTYTLSSFGEWAEESFSPTENDTMLRVFSSGDWVVEVEFEPAAPLVEKYLVMVENISEGTRWEGEITLRGEIEEVSFSD
jgi:putative hemolysin